MCIIPSWFSSVKEELSYCLFTYIFFWGKIHTASHSNVSFRNSHVALCGALLNLLCVVAILKRAWRVLSVILTSWGEVLLYFIHCLLLWKTKSDKTMHRQTFLVFSLVCPRDHSLHTEADRQTPENNVYLSPRYFLERVNKMAPWEAALLLPSEEQKVSWSF